MPIDVNVARMVDNGNFEMYENRYLKAAAEAIDNKINN